MIKRNVLGVLVVLVSLGVSNTALSADNPLAIEPEAAQILRQMSDYLDSLINSRFALTTPSTR